MFFSLRRWIERNAAQRRGGRKIKPQRRWMRPRLEALEDRRLLSTIPYVSWHGGPVIANVEIQPIFMGWNGNIPAGTQQYMDAFSKTIAPSPYITSLAEYNAGGTTIGPGTADAGMVDNNVNYVNKIITDSQIQLELQKLIDDPASGIAAPNPNIFYMVILPQTTRVIRDTFGEGTPTKLLGYHFNTTSNGNNVGGQTISYAVDIPSSNTLGLSLNNFLTLVTSHELGEAVTDEAALAPDPNVAGAFDYAGPTGWYYTPMSGGGEIGDLCTSAPPLNLQGYMVQQLWSNFIAQSDTTHCSLIPADGSPLLPGQPNPKQAVARILYNNFKPTPANTAPKPTPAPPAPQGPIGSHQPPPSNPQLPLPVEPTLAVSPTNDLNLAMASQNGLKVSTNGGNTWTSPFTFPIASDGDSSLVFDKSGKLYWANINSSGGISVSVRNPTTGAATAGPYTVNKPPAGYTDTQVFLAADDINDGPQNNNLFATWTQLGPNDSSAIFLSRSSNGGQTWSTPVQVSSSSDGYVWGSTVSVAPNAEVFVAYHSQPGYSGKPGDVVPNTGQTFVTGYSNNLSTQISKTLAFTSGQSDVTNNVQTGSRTIPGTTFWTQGSWTPYVLTDPSRPGYVYVVAANDPNFGVPGNVDHADIVLATSSDYGDTWTTSTVESAGNQPGAANPNSFQLFPTATIDQNGDILISWYSNQRGLTDAQGDYELDTFAAYSTDGGQSWSAPIQLDATAFDPNAGAATVFRGPPPTTTIGNFFGVALSGSQAYVAYNSNTFKGGKPASEQVSFTSFAISGSLDIYGAPGSSTIRIVKQSPTSDIDEVFLNNQLIYAGALSSLNQINIVRNTDVDTFSPLPPGVNLGNVTVFLDYSNGDPVPTGGIDFGGSDLENNLIEANANANYTLSNTSLTIATASQTDTVTLDNVQNAELIGGSSTNTFTLSNWTGNTTINGDGGTVVVGAGTVQTSQLSVSSVAQLTVDSGATLDVNANFTVPNVQNQGMLDIENGIVLSAAVANMGELNPIGIAAIDGSYTQTSNGALNITLGGTAPGSNGYSQLVVTGPTTLAGTLNVALSNGFTPSSGEEFEILKSSALSGTFATENFPSGVNFTTTYDTTDNPNNVTLTAT